MIDGRSVPEHALKGYDREDGDVGDYDSRGGDRVLSRSVRSVCGWVNECVGVGVR